MDAMKECRQQRRRAMGGNELCFEMGKGSPGDLIDEVLEGEVSVKKDSFYTSLRCVYIFPHHPPQPICQQSLLKLSNLIKTPLINM